MDGRKRIQCISSVFENEQLYRRMGEWRGEGPAIKRYNLSGKRQQLSGDETLTMDFGRE